MLLSAATFSQSEQAGSSIIHNSGKEGWSGRSRRCKKGKNKATRGVEQKEADDGLKRVEQNLNKWTS